MKKTAAAAITGLLVICIFSSVNVQAQGKAEKYLGKRSTCLEISRIDETIILDDYTILFESVLNKIYINRLPAQCFGLKIADAFSYSTSFSRLCKQDIISVLEENSRVTARCGLGEFVELKGAGNISDALKLLEEEGVLDSLVKEGAFESAFPERSE